MAGFNFNEIFKIIADNPPSILIAGGVLIILLGGWQENSELIDVGLFAILLGVFLQICYFVYKIAMKKR